MSCEYRHEYKYCLTSAQAALLLQRVRATLPLDSHVGTQGAYIIKSLYFDNAEDDCYYENEDGYSLRAKYRIRYYNQDTSFLRLEKKSKHNGMTKKESCQITQAQCRLLMDGKVPPITEDMPQTQKKLFLEIRLKALVPKVIVIYERVPFVHQAGNVRITFDRGLMSSSSVKHFLDQEIPLKRPVFRTGESLLEVKWDELLPGHIRSQLSLDNLQWTSFSKYYLCRKYNCYGGVRL